MNPFRFKMIRIPIVLWLFRIAFITIMLFFLSGFFKNCTWFGSKNPPSVADAPWAIQTSALVYYAKEYGVHDSIPRIKDYWLAGVDGKYKFYRGIKEFPKRQYGNIAVVRRVK